MSMKCQGANGCGQSWCIHFYEHEETAACSAFDWCADANMNVLCKPVNQGGDDSMAMSNKTREAITLALKLGTAWSSNPDNKQTSTAMRWVHTHLNNPTSGIDGVLEVLRLATNEENKDD